MLVEAFLKALVGSNSYSRFVLERFVLERRVVVLVHVRDEGGDEWWRRVVVRHWLTGQPPPGPDWLAARLY